jgi:hypothetical protein
MLVAGATAYHFGILTSTMHNAWVRYTCGRLKSDFRYSAAIVYNNFPWPETPSDAQRAAVEAAAQAVLDARAQFPGATLADLYDPLTMPPALLKAHHKLDAAVDAAYGRKPGSFKSDAERVAFLFERYQALTSLLPAAPAKRAPRKKRAACSAPHRPDLPAARESPDHRRGVVTHRSLDGRPRGHPQPPRFGGTEVARAQRE